MKALENLQIYMRITIRKIPIDISMKNKQKINTLRLVSNYFRVRVMKKHCRVTKEWYIDTSVNEASCERNVLKLMNYFAVSNHTAARSWKLCFHPANGIALFAFAVEALVPILKRRFSSLSFLLIFIESTIVQLKVAHRADATLVEIRRGSLPSSKTDMTVCCRSKGRADSRLSELINSAGASPPPVLLSALSALSPGSNRRIRTTSPLGRRRLAELSPSWKSRRTAKKRVRPSEAIAIIPRPTTRERTPVRWFFKRGARRS